MDQQPRTQTDADALRERLSALTASMLRINASVDLDTVLREAVESARALTGARYGVITTIGEPIDAQEHILSGFTEDEQRQVEAWTPSALELFEHLRALPGPLRLRDLQPYLASLGLPAGSLPVQCRAFLATPMRHGDAHVGSFFLAEKHARAPFTHDDEELLALFATAAAAAVANAWGRRDVETARTRLEALIDTSPVGVMVIDAKTARPTTFNREAHRLVEPLDDIGRSPAELIETVTARYAGGQEVSIAQLLECEELRAVEMELSVPDGRRVLVLVNATPVRSADGRLESVIVTLQDLAPLEELERSRGEFLRMVSHELRAPLTSIKGSAASALRTSRTLDPAEQRQFFRIIEQQADRIDDLVADLLDAGRIDTGTLSVDPVPAALPTLVDEARNTFLSAGGRHSAGDRTASRPAARPGRRATRHPSAEQPFRQRRPALPTVPSDPRHCRGGWRPRRRLRRRRGGGRARRASAVPVQ